MNRMDFQVFVSQNLKASALLYGTNLGVDMGEPRASGGCMDSYVVSYASLQKNIHSLFAENAACIIKNPADTFKCIQLHAHSVNKCKYTVNLMGSLVAKNLRGEKNA